MKNLSLVLNAVLIIAVGVLYYLHFSSSAEPQIVPQPEAVKDTIKETVKLPEIRSVNGPIAYIDAEQLNEKYAYIKDLDNQLMNYLEQQKAALQKKAQKLNDDYEQFAQSAKALTPDIISIRQEEFKTRQYELMEEEQRLQEEIAGKQADNFKKVLKKVDDHLRELSKEKNYSYVFTYSKGGPATIVFANDSLEITSEVIAGLNNAYKPKKK